MRIFANSRRRSPQRFQCRSQSIYVVCPVSLGTDEARFGIVPVRFPGDESDGALRMFFQIPGFVLGRRGRMVLDLSLIHI